MKNKAKSNNSELKKIDDLERQIEDLKEERNGLRSEVDCRMDQIQNLQATRLKQFEDHDRDYTEFLDKILRISPFRHVRCWFGFHILVNHTRWRTDFGDCSRYNCANCGKHIIMWNIKTHGGNKK